MSARANPKKRKAHIQVPLSVVALLIWSMAMLVAILADRMGLAAALDVHFLDWLESRKLDGEITELAAWIPWLWAILLSFMASFFLLYLAHLRERIMIAFGLLIVHFCCLPVLALWGKSGGLAVGLIALAWAIACALIYSLWHLDRTPKNTSHGEN